MVSSTQQSSRIRRRKVSSNGKANKRERRKNGTPPFPIHTETTEPQAVATKEATAKEPTKEVAKKDEPKETKKTKK